MSVSAPSTRRSASPSASDCRSRGRARGCRWRRSRRSRRARRRRSARAAMRASAALIRAACRRVNPTPATVAAPDRRGSRCARRGPTTTGARRALTVKTRLVTVRALSLVPAYTRLVECSKGCHDDERGELVSAYRHVRVPSEGERVRVDDRGTWHVPDHPIIPFIEGDGTGADIWRASQIVFDAAVEKAYGGRRSIAWMEIYAGEKALERLRQGSVAARGDQPGHPRLRRRHQGSADHAGRRRHPQHQRHPPPGPRPLRLRPAGALLPGRARAR